MKGSSYVGSSSVDGGCAWGVRDRESDCWAPDKTKRAASKSDPFVIHAERLRRDRNRALHVHCKVWRAMERILARRDPGERNLVHVAWIREKRPPQLSHLVFHV